MAAILRFPHCESSSPNPYAGSPSWLGNVSDGSLTLKQLTLSSICQCSVCYGGMYKVRLHIQPDNVLTHITSYQSLLATRFFLGLFEGGLLLH
jgi:hypothetical protein